MIKERNAGLRGVHEVPGIASFALRGNFVVLIALTLGYRGSVETVGIEFEEIGAFLALNALVGLVGGGSVILDAIGDFFVEDTIARGLQVITVLALRTNLGVLVVDTVGDGSLKTGVIGQVVLLDAVSAGRGLG